MVFHTQLESCPALNTKQCMNLSPHRKSFSNQEKKRNKTSHLHQKARKSLLTYMYVVLQKTPSLKPSMAKNLCWHHEVLPAKAAFTSTVFLCPCVSFCLVNPSVANTIQWTSFLMLEKVCEHYILLPDSPKKSFAEAVPFCFYGKLQACG